MATDQLEVVNVALGLAGIRAKVTDLSSITQNEAVYAKMLYEPLLRMMLSEGDYDFAFRSEATAVAAVVGHWPFAYVYPAAALRIRQMVPAVFDKFDPQPVEWNIYSYSIRRVLTQVVCDQVIYTYRPAETVWDGLFEHAFEQYLGAAIAFAVANKLEYNTVGVQRALSFLNIATLRDL